MKKVIRITESDLIKLVKKSINEGIKISKDERIKLADNKNFLLVIPLSTDAACKYGAATKWCVSGKESNAFKDYQNACHTVGMIMIKDPKIQEVLNGSKFAFNVWNGGVEIYNELNRAITGENLVDLAKEYDFVDDLKDVVTDFVNYHNNVCSDKVKVKQDTVLRTFPSLFTDDNEDDSFFGSSNEFDIEWVTL